MANILDEYLLRLGFDVDGRSQDKFKSAIREGTFEAQALFTALQDAAQKLGTALGDAADKLNQFYWDAKVFHDTAGNMVSIGQAAEKAGVGFDKAVASYKQFAQNIQTNPGLNSKAQWLAGMSADQWSHASLAEKFQAVLRGIRAEPANIAAANAPQLLGTDWETFQKLSDPEFLRAFERSEQIASDVGLDFNKAASGAHDLYNNLLDVSAIMADISDAALSNMFKESNVNLKDFDTFLDQNGKAIQETVGNIGNALLTAFHAESQFTGMYNQLHDLVVIYDAIGQALKWIADQFDHMAGNDIAKAIMSGVGILPGSGVINGLANMLGGNAGSSGSVPAGTASPDTRNWWQRHAPSWLGGQPAPGAGGGFRGSNGNAVHARGSLATNQQEAYQAARAEGLSDTAARALVANMSGESLRDPGNTSGDYGSAQGIVQWHADRAQAIKDHFGKYPAQMSVAEQTRAAIWEMQTNPAYRESWRKLNSNASAADMVGTLVSNYERPANPYGDTRTRVGYLNGFTPHTAQDRSVPAADWATMLGISPAQAHEALRQIPSKYNAFGDLSGAYGAFGASPYPPASGGSITHDHSDKHSELNQKTTIHVYADGGEEIGSQIARHQSSVNQNLIRDLGAVAVG